MHLIPSLNDKQKQKKVEAVTSFIFMVSKITAIQSPLDNEEIRPVNLKGNQQWILIERTDAEAPVFWSPDMTRQLIGKVPDAGKDWGQEEKRASEDEMAEWHHWCNGHKIGKTSGDGEGQGGLTCCSPQVVKTQTQWGNWKTTVQSLQAVTATIKLKDACSLEEKLWQT